MKMPRFLRNFILIVWPFVMFILIIQASGKVCISYKGFAIDDDRNIYVGKSNIEVLNSEGKVIKKIDPMTSRGYKFTIDRNNEILISTGDYLYRKDLFGQLIEKKAISNITDDLLSGLSRYKYTANDGTKYVMKMHFFRTNIYRIEGQEKVSVYKMPLIDYFVRLLSYIVYGSIAIIVPIGITIWRRSQKHYQGTSSKQING